jgi:hypothetical protein
MSTVNRRKQPPLAIAKVLQVLDLPWIEFNRRLMKLDEANAKRLLEQEASPKGRRRLTMLLRIHARVSRQRHLRERAEMAKRARG